MKCLSMDFPVETVRKKLDRQGYFFFSSTIPISFCIPWQVFGGMKVQSKDINSLHGKYAPLIYFFINKKTRLIEAI